MTVAALLFLASLPPHAEGRILGWEWSYAVTRWGVNAYVERAGSGLPNVPWWPMAPLGEL